MLDEKIIRAADSSDAHQLKTGEIVMVIDGSVSPYDRAVLVSAVELLTEGRMSTEAISAAVAYYLPESSYCAVGAVERASRLKAIDRIKVEPPSELQSDEGRSYFSRVAKLRELFLLAYTDLEL